jgi:hypothetical protein
MTVIQDKPKITVQNERGGTWFGNPFSHIPESQSSQPMFKKKKSPVENNEVTLFRYLKENRSGEV